MYTVSRRDRTRHCGLLSAADPLFPLSLALYTISLRRCFPSRLPFSVPDVSEHHFRHDFYVKQSKTPAMIRATCISNKG